MGKWTDKLYITQGEWSTVYGGRNAGKNREGPAFKALPHDCCSLTLAPFVDPVCTPQGIVFDRPHIIPYLAAHENTNPVDGSPLRPEDLLGITFSPTSGGHQCPVTLKAFTNFSHIIANRRTGQVYSREGVERLKDPQREGTFRDFLTDQPFTVKDLITLQDPTNLGPRNTTNFLHLRPPAKEEKSRGEGDKLEGETTTTVDSSLALTSTACAPRILASKQADEEQLRMFSAVKKSAKVTIRTNMGDIHLELYAGKVPRTVFHFLTLARQGHYAGLSFHRLVPGFVIQGGPSSKENPDADCPSAAGKLEFAPGLSHDARGVVAMANKRGASSQFYITFSPAKHLDRLYPIFGRVVGGWEVLTAMEAMPVDEKARPKKPIIIEDVILVVDPFEEHQVQERKRLDAKHDRIATDPTLLQRRARATVNTPSTIGRYLRR